MKDYLKSVMHLCLPSLKELVFFLSFLKNVARHSTTHLFEAASLIYRTILDLHFKIDVCRNIQSSVYVGSQFSVSIALQHIRTTHFKKKGCLDCLSLNLLLKIASYASYECAATGCNIYKPTSIPSILPFYISFSRYLYKMKLSASSTIH